MTELDNAKNALYELGWSEYESKTYSALVLLRQATASKIAKTSNVPPNRVYQILAQLAENGVVRKITGEGGTTQYFAEDPKAVMENYRRAYSEKVDRALTALEELLERQDYEDPPTTITIFGRREMNHYIQKMVREAEKSIFIAIDTLLEIKYSEIVDLLNERCDEIDIRILTIPQGVNNEYEKDVQKQLSDKIKIRITKNEFTTIFLIKDQDTLLHTVWGYSEIEQSDIDYYGIFTYDKRTAKMFHRTFMNDWMIEGEIGKDKEEDVQETEDQPVAPKGPTLGR